MRRRGEVWLVLFPHVDLRTAKRRPVVIVQSDSLQTDLDQSIVAMISGNLARLGPPSRVRVDRASADRRAGGLRTDSVVACDNLVTVGAREFHKRLGKIGDMAQVDEALRSALALPGP